MSAIYQEVKYKQALEELINNGKLDDNQKQLLLDRLRDTASKEKREKKTDRPHPDFYYFDHWPEFPELTQRALIDLPTKSCLMYQCKEQARYRVHALGYDRPSDREPTKPFIVYCCHAHSEEVGALLQPTKIEDMARRELS